MPLMRALSSWYNRDHEGWVDRGQEFEASEYRALDLVTADLAVYAVSETQKIKVTADPPSLPERDDPEDQTPLVDPPASPSRTSRRRER